MNAHEKYRKPRGYIDATDWCGLCQEAWPCKDGRLEGAEQENATLREALTKIAESEPREGYLSESDMSHMSGGDDCGGCKEVIEIAKNALTHLNGT